MKPKIKSLNGIKRTDSKKRQREVNDIKFRQAKRSNSATSQESSFDCSSESSDPLIEFLPLEWDSGALDEHITIMLDKFDWNVQSQEYCLENINPATFFDVIESTDYSFRQYSNEPKPTLDLVAGDDLFSTALIRSTSENFAFDQEESNARKRGRPRKNSGIDERMSNEQSLVLDVIFDSHIPDTDSA